MSKAQIIVGPVEVALTFSPVGKDIAKGNTPGLPTDAGDLENVFDDFGYTQDGLMIEVESAVEGVSVDQVAIAVQAIAGGPPSERVKTTTIFPEAVFEKLKAAWAGFLEENDAAGDPTIGSIGSLADDALQDVALRFIGAGPSIALPVRTVYMFLANAADNSEISFTRGENRQIPVTFEGVAGIGTEGNEQPLLRIIDSAS